MVKTWVKKCCDTRGYEQEENVEERKEHRDGDVRRYNGEILRILTNNL